MTMFVVAACILILGYYFYCGARRFQRFANRNKIHGHMPGNGQFETEVVGESFYQKNLKKVFRQHGRGDDGRLQAIIQTEPDNPHDANACAVYIAGLQVGHLSKGLARGYVDRLKAQGFGPRTRVTVIARIIGGHPPDKPSYGVILDMPIKE